MLWYDLGMHEMIIAKLKDNSLLILAITTGVTLASIIFQLTYIFSFGIDASLFTLRFDPLMTVLGAVLISVFGLVFISALGANQVMTSMSKSKSIFTSIVLDLMLISIFIAACLMFFYEPDVSYISKLMNKVVAVVLGFMALFAIATGIVEFRSLIKKPYKLSWVNACRRANLFKQASNMQTKRGQQPKTNNNLQLTLLLLMGVIVLPLLLGQAFASSRNTFTTYGKIERDKAELIIWRTNDGFITKIYEIPKKSFLSGFKIRTEISMPYDQLKIRSLAEQKNL